MWLFLSSRRRRPLLPHLCCSCAATTFWKYSQTFSEICMCVCICVCTVGEYTVFFCTTWCMFCKCSSSIHKQPFCWFLSPGRHTHTHTHVPEQNSCCYLQGSFVWVNCFQLSLRCQLCLAKMVPSIFLDSCRRLLLGRFSFRTFPPQQTELHKDSLINLGQSICQFSLRFVRGDFCGFNWDDGGLWFTSPEEQMYAHVQKTDSLEKERGNCYNASTFTSKLNIQLNRASAAHLDRTPANCHWCYAGPQFESRSWASVCVSYWDRFPLR